jgi:hypothetical protein
MEDESWDEAEYNFFSSLSDDDKLYYMHDVMMGEYNNFEDVEFIDIPSVEITITDTHLIIMCDEVHISKKFLSSFRMDGMILEFQEQKDTALFYRIVGNTENMSVN